MADFDVFYYAAVALLSGHSPYTVHGFFLPAWALIPFMPLTLLSPVTAHAVYMIVTLIGILAALYRFRLKPLYIVFVVLLSPAVWSNIWFANLDWVVLLGATLAPRYGIWLVCIKPQMSFGLIGLWAWKKHWVPLIVAGLAFIANYAILGLPDTNVPHGPGYKQTDLFPYALPLFAYLIYRAIKRSDIALALASSGFGSPYYSLTSWLSLTPVARSRKTLLAVLAVSWAIFLAWRLTP